MSYRLQLLLCSFGKLGQIQAASDYKEKSHSNYFLVPSGKTRNYKTNTYLFLIHQGYALEEKNKNTIVLLSESKSFRGKLQHSLYQCFLTTRSMQGNAGHLNDTVSAFGLYLSAICGMMKCCPFLWSATRAGV